MKLIDDDGKEWEIKPSECPPTWWLWRDMWIGVAIALMSAHLIFI